ncbi:hypothetical protein MFLO_13615 [Listeria floridensis FSL S10-1187]|uniref:DUF3324 domain-containing protein n=1 Tax=Listeria floridensis FSL S10-1187 TaxID=1265817 RepID=A0ABN0RCM6_9LIST|nr:DUF916 domain-containing protein [Listeria floridensis]EUJ27205.1 hypothetical protein MFLO_13615 [Listeria floridensis FSL S10-1187]
MKKRWLILPFFLMSMLIILLVPTTAKAGTSMGFSVISNIPENQIDKTKTYFDLQMEPGQVQELEVVVTNSQNQDIIIENNANTAITNDNGIVDYSRTNPKFDKTLKYPFSKIAEVEETTTIPAKSQKSIKIKVTMPKEFFDGIILGGLHFKEKEDDKKADEANKGVQIENRYAYVIGVMLRETDKEVAPDMKLNAITPSQVNYRNVLKANLQNTEQTMIKDLKVEASVTKKRQ